LSPLFNNVVFSFDVFICEILEDSLAASINDLSSDAFQRISVNLNILDFVMLTNEIWQLLDIIVLQSQLAQSFKIVNQGYWNLSDFVTT